MRKSYVEPKLKFFLGDVRSLDSVMDAMAGVDYVFHAAALKQVPSCEFFPLEALRTNALGGENVMSAAVECGVKRVIVLSTDKAVNPVNLYGATKLAAEKLIVQSNAYAANSPTRFSCVRYGNVIGSRGSVIPLFLQQRENGAVLTVTDDRMTRFWLSLEQGVRFVIRAIEEMRGGEVFVPKIPSTRITDVAKAIAPEAQVEVIGISPGEKMHEVLIHEDEARSAVELEDMYVIQPAEALWFGHDWQGRGNPLPEGFHYDSLTNPEWLSLEQIREMIAPIELAFQNRKPA